MKALVYFFSPSGDILTNTLRDAGFDLFIGDGTLNMEQLKICDALIPGKGVFTRETLEQAENLKIISKGGVGMDRIDIDACTELGIWACNTPLVNYVSVAEHTLALLLAAAKQLLPISKRMHCENPDWYGAHAFQAQELCGKTIALIGFGHIGQRVARLLSGFEMNIIAYDPFVDESVIPEGVTLVRAMEEALPMADFVSVHAAGQKSTAHLIGKDELAMMKPSAVLINTTRGFVIDEEALITALQNRQIAGAALDVFTVEPVKGKNELLLMDNVIATPHSAANTPEASVRSQKAVAENIIAFFNGERPPYPCNNPEQ